MITTAAQESKPKNENSYRKVQNVVTDCTAVLQIHQPQATLRCLICGLQALINELPVRCGECGSRDTVIEGRKELLLLQSIDLEN